MRNLPETGAVNTDQLLSKVGGGDGTRDRTGDGRCFSKMVPRPLAKVDYMGAGNVEVTNSLS